MSEETIYPISEIFESVQGEGFWAGTLMTFIRLAGCNVGKPYTEEARKSLGLSVYQERCTDWAGNSFACDTDFSVHKRMIIEEILTASEVREAYRVCITGGEPLLHDIMPLIEALDAQAKCIHLETSGTKPMMRIKRFEGRRGGRVWITVCPKQNFLTASLAQADEIKILVDASVFDRDRFEQFLNYIKDHEKVYLQPVNYEDSLNMENVQKCLEIQKWHKKLKLSLQLHKILNCR